MSCASHVKKKTQKQNNRVFSGLCLFDLQFSIIFLIFRVCVLFSILLCVLSIFSCYWSPNSTTLLCSCSQSITLTQYGLRHNEFGAMLMNRILMNDDDSCARFDASIEADKIT